jgi:hypothetical protein
MVGRKVETICTAANNLQTSFDRYVFERNCINASLEKKIVSPYDTAKPLYTASINLHSTLVVLRGATRYLHLSRRLALQIVETNPQKTTVDPHALLRAAVTISELSTLPSYEPTNNRLTTPRNATVRNATHHPNARKHNPPPNNPKTPTSSK